MAGIAAGVVLRVLLHRFHAQGGDVRRAFAAGFLDVVDAARHRPALGAVEQGGFLGDGAVLVGLERGMIESAPAERLAGFDDFVEAFAFAFAQPDGFLGAQVGAHDFQEGVTAALDLGHEPLADDPAQGVGQPRADLLLLVRSRTYPRMRLMVCPASIVCSVLSTRWPVSAALSAILTVSRSRISPTKITFGAWRRAARRPLEKLSKSVPSSRWLKVAM